MLFKAATSVAFPADPNATRWAGGPNGIVDWFSSRAGGKALVCTPAELVRRYAGWVYACANISATTLASLPLRLYAARGAGEPKARCPARPVGKLETKRLRLRMAHKAEVSHAEELEEITEHPLLDLLKHVNPANNQFDLKEQTSQALDLTGNALWYLKPGPLGQPEEIWNLLPQLITLKREPERGVVGYLYGRGAVGEQVKLSPDEVIHFRYPNPSDPWWGLGPVQAGIMAVARSEGMDTYEHATLRNMGRPDIAVVYKGGKLQEDERRDLELAWNNAYGGPDKAGKVRVMDEDYEVKDFGWSPREMAFLQGRNWTLKEIAAMFPVPVALLDTEQISRAPRSGMDGTAMFMGQYNTLPRSRRIEEKLNERLCPLYDERLFLAFDNPVPEDVAGELAADTALLNTFAVTINEVRGHRGLEPVEWGERPWAPARLQPLGTPAPQPTPFSPFSPLGNAPQSGKPGEPATPQEESSEELQPSNAAAEKSASAGGLFVECGPDGRAL